MSTKPYRTGGAAIARPSSAIAVWRALAADPSAVPTRLLAALRRRTARPYLAYIGIPLAIVASALTAPVLVLALTACAWWWTPRDWGWRWVLVVGRGLVGTEWALVGINLFAVYPHSQLSAGFVWASTAAFLAWLGSVTGTVGTPRV